MAEEAVKERHEREPGEKPVLIPVEGKQEETGGNETTEEGQAKGYRRVRGETVAFPGGSRRGGGRKRGHNVKLSR
jgi:hypothetical protein